MAQVTAPLARRDNFPYRKLGNREIRLVVVEEHARWPGESSLACSIQYMTLPENPTSPIPYTAISYTWGDGKDVTSLKLLDESTRNSGEITVTSSLISALQVILEPGRRHSLWIDQICIDQSSPEEKGQQVQLMRWIYERAALVRVWLGNATDDSDEAMLYLENNDRTSLARDLSDPSRIRFTSRLREALKRLFRRPYWARTWTVQEVTALSSLQTMISCGQRCVSLERIFSWASEADASLCYTESIADLQGADIPIVQRFWYLRREKAPALSILVERVRELKASDPRDKVYSMLNYATDTDRSGIRPDYAKNVRQTYTELVLWFIGQYQCLDILGQCHPSLKDDDAGPSWVPDWSKGEWVFPFWKISTPRDLESSPLYRASGDYVHDVGVRHVEVNTRLLSLSGIKVGNLAAVLNRVPVGDTWAVQETWQPENGNIICPLNMIDMREVFRRTIHLDVFVLLMSDKTERGNTLPLPWDAEGMNASPEHAYTASLYSQTMGYGRCPFYTKPCVGFSQGLLGLSVVTARPGDEIWILKGGKVPFILRPKAMTIPHTDLETGEACELTVDAGMPTYELVGEAFVLGLMDGEIIDMLGETPKRKRPPPLADMDREFRTIGLI